MKGLFQCPPWARSFCPFRAYWVISTVQVKKAFFRRKIQYNAGKYVNKRKKDDFLFSPIKPFRIFGVKLND